MQRVTTITVGLFFVLAVALIGVFVRSPSGKPGKAVPSARPETKAKPAASAPAVASGDPALLDLLAAPPSSADVGFDILPDGSKAPPLPDTAPQSVKWGVILFTYQGAQSAAENARPKEQARERALAVVEEAKKDFAAAAARGDQGSRADVGRIQRGILEPAAEYVLFTLPKGEVSSQPIDTPRGYYVVRRNE
jgi:hypothetical protein